jgi:polyferredoxin
VREVALAMRSHIDLSVQHDRAPLFVKMRDGSLRNGYTIKIANKTTVAAEFELSMTGMPGAEMAVAEEGEGRAPRLTLNVAADSVGTFSVLVFGRPARLTKGSQPVDFTTSNTATGEQTLYHSIFLGPGGRQ